MRSYLTADTVLRDRGDESESWSKSGVQEPSNMSVEFTCLTQKN